MRLGRPCEQHHAADQIPRTERLVDNRGQPFAAFWIAFLQQQRLGPGGNVGQRIVDLVPGAIRQFPRRLQASLGQ